MCFNTDVFFFLPFFHFLWKCSVLCSCSFVGSPMFKRRGWYQHSCESVTNPAEQLLWRQCLCDIPRRPISELYISLCLSVKLRNWKYICGSSLAVETYYCLRILVQWEFGNNWQHFPFVCCYIYLFIHFFLYLNTKWPCQLWLVCVCKKAEFITSLWL